jgi:hypothetical protein
MFSLSVGALKTDALSGVLPGQTRITLPRHLPRDRSQGRKDKKWKRAFRVDTVIPLYRRASVRAFAETGFSRGGEFHAARCEDGLPDS